MPLHDDFIACAPHLEDLRDACVAIMGAGLRQRELQCTAHLEDYSVWAACNTGFMLTIAGIQPNSLVAELTGTCYVINDLFILREDFRE